jgi:hypothetical protein
MRMSWFARIDRFASAHMVRSQDANFGCGISSICMVNFKMKKGLLAAGLAAGAAVSTVPVVGSYVGATLASAALNDAVRSEEEVRLIYQQVSGHNVDLNASGAAWNQYVAVLAALGLGTWVGVDTGTTGFVQGVVDATADGAPVIVVVGYAGGAEHAMVIDETHSWSGGHYLCVCDPWDGELRLVWGAAGAAAPVYDASVQPISFTLWGDRRSSERAQPGTFNRWIVKRA